MSRKTFSRLALGTLLAVVALIATPTAQALGTPAGTVISNQATVDFEDANGNPLQQLSNIVETTVSAVEGVDIAPATSSLTGDPGDLICHFHTLTNTGNDTDKIDVNTAGAPFGWAVTVYEDTDASGDYTAGVDTALVDNDANGSVDTDDLANDGTMDVLVCVQIPNNAGDTDAEDTTVTVSSANDPLVTDSAVDTTTVTAPDLTVVKEVNPATDQPPGATLTYTVEITNNGSADALNVVLTDPIPANTTYVGGSASTDQGSITSTAPITADIGTIVAGDTVTVTFQVTID
jgi:uncharacterized repeat protein (TIGR01451 family)